jgi:exonuclease SbcC
MVAVEAELTAVKADIKNLGFDAGYEKVCETSLRTAEDQVRTLDTEIAVLRNDVKYGTEKIESLERVIHRIAAIGDKITTMKTEIARLKLTRTTISDYVVYVMQVVRAQIETEVSQVFAEITGGRYSQVKLDEDFNLLVHDGDGYFPVSRFSGGEQDDLAVALRIALSRYLAELNHVHESTLLIFDEVFGSQDEERRTNLINAIRSQETRFPQILMISHISEVQGEFATAMMVESSGDQRSSVRCIDR